MAQRHKSFFHRLCMPQKELERYYRKQRGADFREYKRLRGITLRERLHYILATGIAVEHFFDGKKLHIISDKRTKTDKPIIYTSTHIGWDDAEINLRAIQKLFYFFVGDPREIYHNLECFLFDKRNAGGL